MAETSQEEQKVTTETPSAEAMLEMIIMKEDEIRNRMRKAETESQRVVEEAKLEAAALKRDAVTADVGHDLRGKEMEKAQAEAEKASREIAARTEQIRARGKEKLEDAVGVVIKGVLPPE